MLKGCSLAQSQYLVLKQQAQAKGWVDCINQGEQQVVGGSLVRSGGAVSDVDLATFAQTGIHAGTGICVILRKTDVLC